MGLNENGQTEKRTNEQTNITFRGNLFLKNILYQPLLEAEEKYDDDEKHYTETDNERD